MEKIRFALGDRVCALRDHPSTNEYIYQGLTGTICDLSGTTQQVGVRWDIDIHGHDAHDTCDYGHGWYVDFSEISLIDNDLDFDIAEDDEFMSFLFSKK